MRLHLVIQRHGLPTTRVLWTTSSPSSGSSKGNSAVLSFATVSSSTLTSTRAPNSGFGAGASAAASGSGGLTIAQLLEDVNEVIPLETHVEDGIGGSDGIGDAGQWGLEDYAVEVMGFECLHFMEVDGLLRDGDEVVRLTGRHQITIDGKHLIDGVPFGKPYIQKATSSRPPITIPPRKKRRLNFGGWRIDDALAGDYNDEDEYDEENDPEWKEEVDGAGKELVVAARDVDHSDDDDDEYEYQSESDESAVTPSEEAIMAYERRTEEQPGAKATGSLPSTRGSKKQATKRQKREAQANLGVVERKVHGILHRKGQTGSTSSQKQSASVSFEDQQNVDSEGSKASDAESVSDGVSVSSTDQSSDENETSSISSSDSSSSEASSEASSNSSGNSSTSGSEAIKSPTFSAKRQTTTSLTETDTKTTIAAPRVIDHPPGTGSRKTKNTNRRNKLRRKLEKLKELGILHKDANFDDLRKWCEANPGPFPEVLGEATPGTQTKVVDEQAEFERKREQLLRDISNGVHGSPRLTRNTNTFSPPESLSTTPINGANGAPSKTGKSSKRKSISDVPSSQQLVFDSLGLKRPKTKENEGALPEKLTPKELPWVEDVDEPTETKIDIIENWQDRLILQATECLYDDVKLSAPPFPFVQRWDKDAQAKIRELKGSQQVSGKKRKRKSRNHWVEDYHDDCCNGEASFSNENHLDYGGDGAGEHPATPAKSLNRAAPGPQIQDATGMEAAPPERDDVSTLKDAQGADMKPGTIIAFKQLDMSKATNWQPLVSEYRTAVVESVVDGTLTMRLARQHREQPPQSHDDNDNGVAQYTKFEMPGYDEWKGEDDGFREMKFEELIEPKLLSAGSGDSLVEVAEETQNPSVGINSPLMLMRLPTYPIPEPVSLNFPPSIPEVVTVSSPTRHKISTMIREAGFRSGFDSDFLPPEAPEDAFFDAQSSRTNNGFDGVATPIVKSPIFAGFTSSPPLSPSRHCHRNDSLVSKSSGNCSPLDVPGKRIIAEVLSSFSCIQDVMTDAFAFKPEPEHQKSPALLSGDQPQTLESGYLLVQDSIPSTKDQATTAQLDPPIDETHIETDLDPGTKSADDVPIDDCAQHVQPMALLSADIYHSSFASLKLDRMTLDHDDSQFSVLASAVEDSQPAEHRPDSSGESVITNPFYEPDKGFPTVSPPMARFVSTAPPRTTTAAENSPPRPAVRKNNRKALSSPHQLSSSPHQKPQCYDERIPNISPSEECHKRAVVLL
ncbi:conserved hypothetical protein [Histoplasma capsulatum H143]|uniref:DUF7357 domain-containing protein n=1 Tax=Ajellomyces capsulatus (strain H143) TaxID=544712 RepID=C6H3P3_AJECH|nr:conserved hypothetical protein [Histoplasma capsulatum H143]